MDHTKNDPQLWAAIAAEENRQQGNIELIASENIVSEAVLKAQGSVLTNKYAEGYPGKRYYGGCEFVDVVEQLAIDRAKELFGASYANVQPHSGSQANAAFREFCKIKLSFKIWNFFSVFVQQLIISVIIFCHHQSVCRR